MRESSVDTFSTNPYLVSGIPEECGIDIRVASSPTSLHSASLSFLTPETLINPHSALHVSVSVSVSGISPSDSKSRFTNDRRWIE